MVDSDDTDLLRIRFPLDFTLPIFYLFQEVWGTNFVRNFTGLAFKLCGSA